MSLVVLTTAVAHLAQRLNFKYHFWPAIICKILFLEGGRKPELCSEPPLTPRSPIFLVGPSCLSNWTNHSDRCWNSFEMDGSFFKLPCVSQYSICWTMFSQKAHYSIHSSTSAISCHSELHIFIKNEWGFIMSCVCGSSAWSELQNLSTLDTLSALSWPSTDCCFLSASRRPSDAYPVVPSTTTTFTISHSTSLLVVCTHTQTVWINNSQSRLAQAVPWHAWHQSGNVKTLCTAAVLGTHAQWKVTPSAGMPSLPTTPTLLCVWVDCSSRLLNCNLLSALRLAIVQRAGGCLVYLPGNWLKSLGSALLYLCRPLVFITGKTAT